MHSNSAAAMPGVVYTARKEPAIADKGILIGIYSLIHGKAQVLQFIF